MIGIALLMLVVAAACQVPRSKSYVIGIVNLSPPLDAVVDGFKAGMADLGYVEGENTTFIYDRVITNMQALDPAIQKLVAADVDLILSLTTPATLKVKQASEGTDIPVVFVPVTDPVGSGVVESLTQPGGNLTGIRTGGSIAKGLDWLLTIAPGTTHVYVPHNPDDSSSVRALKELSEPAAALGLELNIVETRTTDDFEMAMEAIPDSMDAIFMLPSGFFARLTTRFVDTAIAKRLPVISVGPQYQAGVPISYGHNYPPMGKQASRLADQVLRGTAPADLPIERTEFFLSINLRTAEAIGLDIADDILAQTDTLIR
jgi:putative ABC transport system substrate-binding protein